MSKNSKKSIFITFMYFRVFSPCSLYKNCKKFWSL